MNNVEYIDKHRSSVAREMGYPLSVILVTPWFPNRPDEQVGNFVYDSAAGLARLGMDVHILVCRPFVPSILMSHAPQWMRGIVDISAFGEFGSVSVIQYPHLPRGWLRPLTSALFQQRVVRALSELALRSRAQLIHAHTEGFATAALAAGERMRLPIVVTVHGENSDRRLVENPSVRRALGNADRVLVVGRPLLPFVYTLMDRSDHVRVVHNGVRVPVDLARVQILRESRPVRFISVSNLHEGKGIDITMRALAMVQKLGFTEWNYTIVGDGAQRPELTNLAKSLKLENKVNFVGSQPHERIYELLSDADVFVLPSYREAFGISYLEAMAAGLVTIGVRGQGPAAFIEHGKTGYLVDPNSPRSLAVCILDIVARPEVARQIGIAGAELVRSEFTWDAHARHLTEVYQELVE